MNLYRDALDNGDRVVKEWREMDIAQMDWLQYLNYDWTSPYESKFPQERFQTLAERVSEYQKPYVHILVSKKSMLIAVKWQKVRNCSIGVWQRLWHTQPY